MCDYERQSPSGFVRPPRGEPGATHAASAIWVLIKAQMSDFETHAKPCRATGEGGTGKGGERRNKTKRTGEGGNQEGGQANVRCSALLLQQLQHDLCLGLDLAHHHGLPVACRWQLVGYTEDNNHPLPALALPRKTDYLLRHGSLAALFLSLMRPRCMKMINALILQCSNSHPRPCEMQAPEPSHPLTCGWLRPHHLA